MPLFWIYCVCLLSFLATTDSVTWADNKCSKNDCSYQVQDFMNHTCKIYNSSVCLDFYKFEESSEDTLTPEEDFNLHVSVVPYTADIFDTVDALLNTSVTKSPAINITFTVNNSDIDKVMFKIYKKNISEPPICRIFDLHNVKNSTNAKFPINFFYDCLYNMPQEEGLQKVEMDFTALSIKEKLSYYVFIPETEGPGSCSWQPLIMVFKGNLHNGVVQVKFSQAPELYNVSYYKIKLTHLSVGEETLDITPDKSRKMLFIQFTSVDGGAYSVSVKPVVWGVNLTEIDCWTKTDIFLIEKLKSDHMLTIYLCIFILLIFSAFVFLKMFRHNISKLRFGTKQQILLVYSHDCKEHKDFIVAFIQYLIKYCHVVVSTIYDELPINWNPDEKPMNIILNLNECNPQEWIKKKYEECDIIMFVISAGLFYTLDSKQFRPIQKYHEWRKQLLWAKNLILNELLNNAKDIKKKKICKVCFPYSSIKHIPDTLMIGFGECYALPQEMNNLLNFMHDSGECFRCRKLCVSNFESSFKGTYLSEKMEAVQKAVDDNSHCHFIDDTSMNDLNSDVEHDNLDEISTTSYSSDENPDAVNNFLSGSKSKFKYDNLDEISTSSYSSGENPNAVNNFLSGSKSIFNSEEKIASMSSSDNIQVVARSEKFFDTDIDEPVRDSDTEESDLLPTKPKKLHSENEAKVVIDHILNKNRT